MTATTGLIAVTAFILGGFSVSCFMLAMEALANGDLDMMAVDRAAIDKADNVIPIRLGKR